MRTDALDLGALGQLMPMHLLLDADGAIIAGGPTIRKLIGAVRHLDEAFTLERPHPGERSPAEALGAAAHSGERVFLRHLQAPWAVLRGHAVRASDGRLVLNLGFGIGLPQSVRHMNLTDADFAPSDLAMELLFLHEANAAAMSALSRYNLRLDEARQAAMAQSATDPLTGLVNRRGLEAALAAAAADLLPDGALGARRAGDPAGFALMQIDLDGFKAVNDTHGHGIGDRLLQHVAVVLREETRVSDTVARPGGDEFVLIVRGMVSHHALSMMAERIIARIEVPVTLEAVTVGVSASIGIAVSTDYPAHEVDAMAADADAALYAAKRGGRGRACIAPGPRQPTPPPPPRREGQLIPFDAARRP